MEEPPAVGAAAEGRAIAVPEIVGEAQPETIPENSRAAKIPTGSRFRACAFMNSLRSAAGGVPRDGIGSPGDLRLRVVKNGFTAAREFMKAPSAD
ncbi:hypothetical protein SAMN04489732_101699 [Amycolatopsis saalfeldensis]|uniref:Uncharacterized protein n=1 Tax=Amycolatopsis saalfeldensis TaxID=394193 RepID=A0A1H8RA85_9PSEU|nr:hypothetical protein SAMN04489732_101699 [Amycolatopsis saalfeldensis]